MPTIADVAKQSGFSIATVSNVLNNGPKPVRADTRERVLSAARQLDYHPNAMAQGLVRRRMNTLGIYFHVPNSTLVMSNPYSSGLLEGILKATAETGYNLTFFTRNWVSADESAAAFRDGRADGMLVIAPTLDSDVLFGLSRLGLTVVAISGQSASKDIPVVDVDNILGTKMAIDHLRSLGHRRIAYLAGNDNMYSASVRRDTFLQHAKDIGLDVPPEYICRCTYDARTSYAETRRLLGLADRPTAICGGNDAIAIAVIAAARDMDINVPSDLSVIGFDDVQAAALIQPALTTVHQPLVDIGERAAHLLVALVEERENAPPSVFVKPELVVRGSTAPVAAEIRPPTPLRRIPVSDGLR